MSESAAFELDSARVPAAAAPRARSLSVRALAGLLFAGFALYASHIEHPESYIYDEVYHAYTATEYVRGNADAYLWNTTAPRQGVAYMWNHPPLGLHIMGMGIRLWGDNSLGWRFMSAVFGGIGIVLLFFLARALMEDTAAALLASVLLMLDGLYYVQSRTAMLDVFGVVFMLVAFLGLVEFLKRPPERSLAPLLLMGVALGLAIATKWNAVYAAALIIFVATVQTIVERVPARQAWKLPLALVLLPAVVYLAAYIPFFSTGHTLGQFLELQHQIYAYHAGLKATHTYQSAWWQWPLALRPVWYYVAGNGTTVENIYANVNPLLAWGFLPAVAWTSVRWWRERPLAAVVLMIGFFGQWMPWALIPRIAFAYHFLPAVTFGCIAVASTCAAGVRRGGFLRVVALVYLVVVAAAFAFFLPVWSGMPLTHAAFESRMWIPSWR